MMLPLRVKICGITQPQQAHQIAEFGATALGFICVKTSPRFIVAEKIGEIIANLTAHPKGPISTIGVFADAEPIFLEQVMTHAPLSGIQLHGNETPQDCAAIKAQYPSLELIKAFRIKDDESLKHVDAFGPYVDTFLLDAFHPQALGGTGHRWDWSLLKNMTFSRPWLLAGGLTPENVVEAVNSCAPNGIDLSSGVERSPGIKDLQKVEQLFDRLKGYGE